MAPATSSSARWEERRRTRSGSTTCAPTPPWSFATTPPSRRCGSARSRTRPSGRGYGSSPSRHIRRTRNTRRRPHDGSRSSSQSREAKGAPIVRVVDAIARILKTEGTEFLSAYPTTSVIEAAAKVDIRPVLCRQERVGVGIADGYARVKNGKTLAVFCMQYGPGAENAFPGVATAYSDSTPMLLLPLGHPRDRAQVFPLFSSARTYASVTKSVETITVGTQVADVMRRAISLMRMGGPGPARGDPACNFLRGPAVFSATVRPSPRHGMAASIPAGKTLIHATNDERDLNKNYAADYPLLGDARLVLRQFIEAIKVQGGRPAGRERVRAELECVRAAWLAEWTPTLGSAEVPINPYRVIAEFMRTVDPRDAIVTPDSGGPRDQLLPFYRAVPPRSYLGWGKSHALGTGLGLIIGAKLAAPEKLCVNFMGDAAFGMTGLDFETAVRCGIPILTVVLNNSAMAIEIPHLVVSHDKYGARNIGGGHAAPRRAPGGGGGGGEGPAESTRAFAPARRGPAAGP